MIATATRWDSRGRTNHPFSELAAINRMMRPMSRTNISMVSSLEQTGN